MGRRRTRRSTRARAAEAPRPLLIRRRRDDKADGRWFVTPMSGAASRKPYRCPGCQQSIPAGTPHLVVWPELPGPSVAVSAAATGGVDERRHWHTACWQRRR